MSEPTYTDGGFGDSMLDQMSPSMRARVLAADAEYDKQARVEEREREQQRERMREQATRASIEAAVQRGEAVDLPRALRDGGIGRLPSEAIAYSSAMMDIEDQRRAAQVRKEFEQWQQGYYHDTTAPTPAEVEQKAEVERHALAFERRQIERKRKDAERKEADARMLAVARSVVRDHG